MKTKIYYITGLLRWPLHLVIGCLLTSVNAARSQDPVPNDKSVPHMRAYALSSVPHMDGLIDDEWMLFEPASGFIQQLPDEGQPASERTEVRIGYTSEALYIGVICFDSNPEAIVSNQARRDGRLDDTDTIEILLDTFNDDQNGYVFSTTPAGNEYDGQVIHGGQAQQTGSPARAGASGQAGAQRGGASTFNLNWDTVWMVRTQVTERGWEAEFEIPFRSLRYATGAEQVWGINFKRNIRRKNEQVFWAPVTRGFKGTRVSLAGVLEGMEVDFKRNLQVIPFFIGGLKQTFTKVPFGNRAARDVGLDVKYTLTSSLTLDLTANTDFAQVEVDEEQVNLTRFDLFFPEKRPFFLENAGFFEVGSPRQVELFFSRRIGIDPSGAQVPLIGGARVTGKQGKFNLGFMSMQTESVNGVVAANNFTVARVAREFGTRSSVGVIAINKVATGTPDGVGIYNRTFGVDANLGFGENLTVFNYIAKTQTPGLVGRDHAASTSIAYKTDFLSWDIGYQEVGKSFNPEVGFVRRTDYRRPSYGIFFSPRPKNSRIIRRFWPHHSWRGYYTFDGRMESGFRHNDIRVFFQNGGSVGFAFNQNFEQLFKSFEIHPEVILPVGIYKFDNWVATLESDESAMFFGAGNFSKGDFFSGNIQTLSLRTGFRMGAKFLASLRYIHNDVELPEDEFTTHLGILQFNYSFTPKSFIQSLIQVNTARKEIGVNIRFSLLRTANTGLFVVYNNRFDTIGFDPHDGAVPSLYPIHRRTLDRALIVKFTHLFDF